MDWKEIIEMAMQRNSLTQVQLARRVQCGQTTISDLRNGTTMEPRYSLGLRLLELANSDVADLAGVTRPVLKADQATGLDIQPAAAGQGV